MSFVTWLAMTSLHAQEGHGLDLWIISMKPSHGYHADPMPLRVPNISKIPFANANGRECSANLPDCVRFWIPHLVKFFFPSWSLGQRKSLSVSHIFQCFFALCGSPGFATLQQKGWWKISNFKCQVKPVISLEGLGQWTKEIKAPHMKCRGKSFDIDIWGAGCRATLALTFSFMFLILKLKTCNICICTLDLKDQQKQSKQNIPTGCIPFYTIYHFATAHPSLLLQKPPIHLELLEILQHFVTWFLFTRQKLERVNTNVNTIGIGKPSKNTVPIVSAIAKKTLKNFNWTGFIQ